MPSTTSNSSVLAEGTDSRLTQEASAATRMSQMEMIADLNNMGVELVESSHLHEATQFLRRSLSKANEVVFFNEPNLQSNIGNAGAPKNLYIYQRGEYDEGMQTFSSPIRIDTELSSIHAATATILYNLGQIFVRTNNNQGASSSFLRALQIFQCGSDDCTTSKKAVKQAGGVTVVAILSNIGNVLYRAGRFEEAIRTFQKALEASTAAPATCTHRMLEVASTLNSLGVLSFHLPKAETDKALAYYEESLMIRRTALGHNAVTKEIATTVSRRMDSLTKLLCCSIPNLSLALFLGQLNNIGRIYYMKGDLDQALRIYSNALSLRRQLFGNDHLDVAAIFYNSGQTLHQKGRLDEAMELYGGFLRIARKRLGHNHRDVAIMLKCMAQIHHERSEFNDACKLYQEALRVGQAALGLNHPEIASTLNKLGNCLYEMGDTEGALKIYQEGLKVERAVLNPSHPNIVVTLTNIGQIHKLLGEYHSALLMYKEAVGIQQRNQDSSTTDIAATLSAIALIHYQTHSYSKALEVYQEALRIRRDACGDDNLEVASTLNSLGLVLFKMGLYDYALQSFHGSLRIRYKLLGKDHHDCAVILYNVATIHLDQGDDDRAMPYYKETLRVERASLGHNHPDVILTMEHVGRVHQQRGELHDALNHFLEALELKMAVADENRDHALIALTCNDIGNVYLQMGRAQEMVDAFACATRHLKKAGRNENDLVITGFNFYGLAKLHPECAPLA
jgi:tetratricopeptide (TPR) repeat protein